MNTKIRKNSLFSFLGDRRGLAQIPLMIGLLIMAIAVPAATKLVQQQQDKRSSAATQCSRCSANDGCTWVTFQGTDATCNNPVAGTVVKTIVPESTCGKRYGAGGGTDANCPTTPAVSNPACGSANGTTVTGLPTTSTLCSSGSSYNLASSNLKWTWQCRNTSGTAVSCSANQTPTSTVTCSPTACGSYTNSSNCSGCSSCYWSVGDNRCYSKAPPASVTCSSRGGTCVNSGMCPFGDAFAVEAWTDCASSKTCCDLSGGESCNAKGGVCQTNGGSIPAVNGSCTVGGVAGHYENNLCTGKYNTAYRCCVPGSTTPTTPTTPTCAAAGGSCFAAEGTVNTCSGFTTKYATINGNVYTAKNGTCSSGTCCAVKTGVCTTGQQKCSSDGKGYLTCSAGQWTTSATACASGKTCSAGTVNTNVCTTVSIPLPILSSAKATVGSNNSVLISATGSNITSASVYEGSTLIGSMSNSGGSFIYGIENVAAGTHTYKVVASNAGSTKSSMDCNAITITVAEVQCADRCSANYGCTMTGSYTGLGDCSHPKTTPTYYAVAETVCPKLNDAAKDANCNIAVTNCKPGTFGITVERKSGQTACGAGWGTMTSGLYICENGVWKQSRACGSGKCTDSTSASACVDECTPSTYKCYDKNTSGYCVAGAWDKATCTPNSVCDCGSDGVCDQNEICKPVAVTGSLCEQCRDKTATNNGNLVCKSSTDALDISKWIGEFDFSAPVKTTWLTDMNCDGIVDVRDLSSIVTKFSF